MGGPMTKESMKNLSEHYSDYVQSLKTIVKQNEQDNRRLDSLKREAAVQESTLQHYIHNLKHIQEIQHLEFQRWQAKALELAEQQKKLEKIIEQQSKELAISKAQLEHGLRMIDLAPKSTVADYLANTSINKSLSEAISDDWQYVGAHLAHSMINNKEFDY